MIKLILINGLRVKRLMLTESLIQRNIIAYLKIRGALVFRMNSGKARNNVQLCPPGTPDILTITRDKKVLWIEVKRADGALRPAQREMFKHLESRDQQVILARSVEDVKKYLSD